MTRVLLMLALAGCVADSGPAAVEIAGDCSVVVINSDYLSTSVSLLNRDGTLCRDDLINSGSAPPGVVTALSGDVVAPSEPHPDGLLTLIDRFPNSVLTFVAPDSGAVRGQLSVGTGFAANPQDVVFLGDGRALVSRAETNRTPGTEPFDRGGDLLEIALDPPAIVGRIDLAAAASEDGAARMDPRPAQMAQAADLVWVTLGNLSSDFGRAGPGTVAAVDPETGDLVHVLRDDTLTNCLALAKTAAGLWVGCTGSFAQGADAQLDASGLLWLDPAEATLERVATASELGDQPVSFEVTPVDQNVVYFVGFGSLDGAPDRLFRFDRREGVATPLPVTSAAFQLGSPLLLDGVLLVPDADPTAPVIRRYELPALDEQPGVPPNPGVGLPPRELAVFR